MNNNELYPWIGRPAQEIEQLRAQHRLPHALLIDGPAGLGRLDLARWIAARVLGVDAAGTGPDGSFLHPDLLNVEPPEDKQVLPISAVREMIAFLQLTPHQGGAKVAILRPAAALSHAAANSLLKTLEEPAPGCLIVLIADAPSQLPLTVVSRCRRVRIAAPPVELALDWLREQDPARDWAQLLELAGGAPLKAVQLAEQDFGASAQRLNEDLAALEARRETALAVAQRWAKLDIPACLDWLYRRTAAEIRRALAARNEAGTVHLQNAGDELNMEPVFDCLQETARLRRLQGRGLNETLGLASVLDHWYGGLVGSQRQK